jgi:hypothetical protein
MIHSFGLGVKGCDLPRRRYPAPLRLFTPVISSLVPKGVSRPLSEPGQQIFTNILLFLYNIIKKGDRSARGEMIWREKGCVTFRIRRAQGNAS